MVEIVYKSFVPFYCWLTLPSHSVIANCKIRQMTFFQVIEGRFLLHFSHICRFYSPPYRLMAPLIIPMSPSSGKILLSPRPISYTSSIKYLLHTPCCFPLYLYCSLSLKLCERTGRYQSVTCIQMWLNSRFGVTLEVFAVTLKVSDVIEASCLFNFERFFEEYWKNYYKSTQVLPDQDTIEWRPIITMWVAARSLSSVRAGLQRATLSPYIRILQSSV